VISKGISPSAAIAMMILILAALGCILETLSMLLLMVPIFFPITTALGFNPIWFGILFVMVMELGLITPPIGLNLFIIKSIIKDVSMSTLYRGIIPFILADIIRIIIIIWVPGIVLFLPLLGN
jgi:TRAP-type C4-dicarboxylate transport system permease large subunit